MNNLIIKYITDTISDEELKSLISWLEESKKNQERFKDMIKANHQMDMNYMPIDAENAYKKILERLQNNRSVFKKRYQTIFKYAAISILFFSIGYFHQQDYFNNPTNDEPIIVNNQIETGTDKAVLTLENGKEIALEKGTSFQIQNVNSNGEQIAYEARERNSTEVAYNYLTIPRGGQFSIKLSDGTQVWLNSQSQLKYPVSFKEGEDRQVELIYGEAYFDVSPSTKHKGARFRVINQSQKIEVLGTQFNIKAYKDDDNIYTTLVEGKVSINTSTLNQILKPSEQANLNLNNNTINVSTVNVYNEISWKDGVFSFRKKPLEEIMKVLSRWYNIDVNFVNPELKSEGFNGVLGKDQNIEEILESIKKFKIIEDYEIIDKTVFLK